VLRKLSPPDTRIHADDPAEYSREMRLITHSAIQSDLGERRAGICHEFLGTSDTLSRDVSQRWLAEGLPERPEEVAGTQPRDVRKVASSNARAEVRRNVRREALLLPERKASASC
jgi:hypothetical protein